LPQGAPPNLAAFDHAIAYVPALDLYLDGTAEGAGSTELPEMDHGAVGLVVLADGARLVRLPTPAAEASPTQRRIELSLAADGSASAAFEQSVRGVRAPPLRARLNGETTRRARALDEVAATLGHVVPGPDTSSLLVRDVDDVEKPLTLSVRGRMSIFARREGSMLSAPIAGELDLLGNVAALSERKTPLLLGARELVEEQRVVRLAPGLKLSRAPEPVELTTRFGSLSLRVEAEPGRLATTSRFSWTLSRIEPADYAAFRAFCQQVDRALGQRWIIEPAR
jgi:hypothetical protein